MTIRTPAAIITLLFVVSGLAGCKEETLGPERLGALEGRVLNYDTKAPIKGASITTSPPTGALVTSEDGAFSVEDVEAGSYTIQGRAPEYQPNSVTVSIRDGETTQATLLLEAEEADSSSASIDVSVANSPTRTSGDSAFVDVEYRVRNTGAIDLSAYEVYFRIQAGDETFYQEERGEALQVGQTDVGRFEKYTLGAEADTVFVDDYWIPDTEATEEGA